MRLLEIIILVFIIGLSTAYSQTDTIIYYASTGEITCSTYADSYINVRCNNKKIILTEFVKNQYDKWERIDRKVIKVRSDTLYTYKSDFYAVNDYNPKDVHVKWVKDTIFYVKEYNYENDLIHEGYYRMIFPKIRHGLTIDYYNNGVKRAESMYMNNQVLWSEKWLLNGEKGIDHVYSVVDEEPAYKGKSIREFRNSIMHELKLYFDDKGINGTVIIEFVIMEDGSLYEVQILQSSSIDLADHVIRVIMATDGHWTPGKINGISVRFIKQFLINFISMSN